MNVFKLVGGDLTSVNSQLVRLAGPTTESIVIESEQDSTALEFAQQVAGLIAGTRPIKELSVFGYELGLASKQRNLKYRVFCIQ
jgi:thiamine pyrophosphokinase